MKRFGKMVFPLISFFLLNYLFPLALARADQPKCSLAVSRSIARMFPEIKTVLKYLEKNSNRRFGYYEESPIDLLKSLKDFPTDKFKIIVATSAELEKIPNNLFSSYGISNRRPMDVEFLLVGREKLSLTELGIPKVAHSSDASLKNFYVDIFLGCIYKNYKSDNKPTDRIYLEKDLELDKLRNRDLVIIKYVPKVQETVGLDILSRIWQASEFPNIPVPYCLKPDETKFKNDLLDCFEKLSTRVSVVKVSYGFRRCKDIDHFRKAIGINSSSIRSDIPASWLYQAVTKRETIVFLHPKAYGEYVTEFIEVLFDTMMDMKYKHSKNRDNKDLSFLATNYKMAVYLLTNGLRGIIEVSNFYFEDAQQSYKEIDDIWGIGAIHQQLTKKENLLKKDQIEYIKRTIGLFKLYYRERKLPKKHVDFNLLSAKYKSTRLLYFLHHHYFNAQREAVDENEKASALKFSTDYLDRSQKMLESWLGDIKAVKEVNDFNYQTMRRKDSFHTQMELSEKFRRILVIK